ncbi:hypothetical protein ACWF94_00375 [Streptomyces sp. NPDC055078]
MTTPPPDPTSPPDLAEEIRTLLGPLHEMHRRHQAQLGEHRTPDGEVFEDRYPQYEEARLDTAIEASDTLDLIRNRLEQLVSAPIPGPFTIALNGLERHDGERPSLWVVNGTDLASARQNLTRLPSFRQWLEDTRAPGDPADRSDVVFIPEESHPGTPPLGSYTDLRHEQNPARTAASAPHTGLPTPRPAGTTPRHSR